MQLPHSEEKIIARLILSTKRKSRKYSIVEIAEDILKLKNILGSLNDVAKAIGISTGMLNQFLSIFKLPPEIQTLIKERKIDSVSLVYSLSRLQASDVKEVAMYIIDKRINSQDLKIFIPYRKQHRDKSVDDLIQEINSSKNIKVAVIKINNEDLNKSRDQLNDIFTKEIGKENLIAIVPNGEHTDIKINKVGESLLKENSKIKKLKFQDYIQSLIG